MRETPRDFLQIAGMVATVLFLITLFLIPSDVMEKAQASPENMVPQLVFNSEAVAGVVTVTSKPFSLRPMKNFGLSIVCAGAAPDITVNYIVSMEYDYPGMTTYAPPERAVNIFGVLPDGSNTSVTDTNYHYESFSPPPVMYCAIVLTGNAGNGAGTTVTVKLALQ